VSFIRFLPECPVGKGALSWENHPERLAMEKKKKSFTIPRCLPQYHNGAPE
jgi:hypothetical protein